VNGNTITLDVQADATQATTAYDAILEKASEIQKAGIYGDEAMIAGAAEFAMSAPVIKCKKTPREKCRLLAGRRKKDRLPRGWKKPGKGDRK